MKYCEMFDCTGRIAIVTGGAGLYGHAISEALCQAGATVIVASRSDKVFNERFTDMKKIHPIYHYKLDLTDVESMKSFVDKAVRDFGGMDILVNNAVTPFGRSIDDTSAFEWTEALNGNVLSLFLLCQMAANDMRKRKKGVIINISSIWGSVAPDYGLYTQANMSPNPIAYSFIKGGINMFTRSLASFLAPDGIRVNCISPGGIADETDTEYYRRAYASKTPLGRWAEPEDIKGAVIYLASDASNYVTGENIMVDGGYTIR